MAKKGEAVKEEKNKISPEEQKTQLAQKQKSFKEKFEPELKKAQISAIKVQTKYREIQRKDSLTIEKANEIKDELKSLEESGLANLKQKTKMIEELKQEIEEADEQHVDAVNGYLLSLDELSRFQTDRFDAAYEHFHERLRELESEFGEERDKIIEKYKSEQSALKSQLKTTENIIGEYVSSESHEWQSLREDDRNKMQEDKQAMRMQMESHIEDLWKQFQKAHDDYTESTDDRRGTYEQLRRKDAENSQIIDEQTKKLVKLQETIVQLKSKFSSNITENEQQLKALKRRKEAVHEHFQIMKRKMGTQRSGEKKNLTRMTVESKGIVQRVEEFTRYAADIVRIAEICARLESSEDRYHGRVLHDIEHSNEKEQNKTKENVLFMFNKKLNKVVIDTMAIEVQIRMEKNENLILKQRLSEKLAGMGVHQNISGVNPELKIIGVSNGTIEKYPNEGSNKVTPVVIDAPQEWRNQLKSMPRN